MFLLLDEECDEFVDCIFNILGMVVGLFFEIFEFIEVEVLFLFVDFFEDIYIGGFIYFDCDVVVKLSDVLEIKFVLVKVVCCDVGELLLSEFLGIRDFVVEYEFLVMK